MDKVSGFGVEPWYWYFQDIFLRTIPPFSLLFLGAFLVLLLFKRKSPIVWTVVPFVLIHCLIGHKEMRFLFPLIGFAPIVVCQGIALIQEKYIPNFAEHKHMKNFMKLFFSVNVLLLLVVSFKPADSQVSLYQKIYKNYENPTTLYYINDNPYLRVLDVHYYKRKNLTIKATNSMHEIPVHENTLVVLRNNNEAGNPRLGKLVYSSYPNWILKLNFNGWVERSGVWYVYEIKNI